jgi:hypothetical protein
VYVKFVYVIFGAINCEWLDMTCQDVT